MMSTTPFSILNCSVSAHRVDRRTSLRAAEKAAQAAIQRRREVKPTGGMAEFWEALIGPRRHIAYLTTNLAPWEAWLDRLAVRVRCHDWTVPQVLAGFLHRRRLARLATLGVIVLAGESPFVCYTQKHLELHNWAGDAAAFAGLFSAGYFKLPKADRNFFAFLIEEGDRSALRAWLEAHQSPLGV